MNERPLFGAGSRPPKHSKSQAAFVRPVVATDEQCLAVTPPAQTHLAQHQTEAQDTAVQPFPDQPTPVQQAPIQPTATPAPAVSSPVVPQNSQPTQVYQEIFNRSAGGKEDRTESRKRSRKGGLIILPGQTMSSYACQIRNESRGGLMLVFPDAMLVPTEFYLQRDADPGRKIPCRVAWRGIGRIGIQFIAELSAP